MNRQPIRVHGDPVIKDVFFNCNSSALNKYEEEAIPCGVVCIDGICFSADQYDKLIKAGVKYWNKHGGGFRKKHRI